MKEKIILRCSLCGKIKKREDFHKGSLKNGLNCWCKECVLSRSKESRRKYPDKFIKRARLWRKNNRERANFLCKKSQYKCRVETIKAYGGKCKCCGETEIKFLSIDHVNNNGKEDRKLHGGGTKFYFYLRRMGYPKKGYQILCYNCNFAKGHYGKCPHKK